MSIEANKQIAWRAMEALVANDQATLAEHPGYWQSARYFPPTFAAFPDLRVELVAQVAEGDQVATRVRLTGTHEGTFLGIAATGKAVGCDAFMIDRVVNGRVVEHNATADLFGLLAQLGAIPGRPPE